MNYPGQRVQIDVKFVPSSCLVNEAKANVFISIPLLMNIPAGGMWKPLKNTAPILTRYFCAIFWNVFLCLLNVSRQTMGQNSQSVFPLLGNRL